MDTSILMRIILTWVLMVPWLSLVAFSGILAFKKWQDTNGSLKRQMFYFWFGALFVFIGDGLHTIAASMVSSYTGKMTGTIEIMGAPFEFRTFAMFFDGVVFMVYYALWILFIVERYQQGRFKAYDKTCLAMAVLAILLLLPGAVPNALGIYTLDYDIAIWSPHIVLFVVFGAMTVGKLIRNSRRFKNQASDEAVKIQEASLFIMGISFGFSFLFFILALALIPINPKFAMFMIPKTFAYMTAFTYLIRGVIRPAPTIDLAGEVSV